MTREPIISTASITAAATALIALAVAFGLPLTDAQTQAILGVVAVAAPLVVILARRWTVPAADVVELDDRGTVKAGPASELPEGTPIRPAGSLHGRYADRDGVLDGKVTPPSSIDVSVESDADPMEVRRAVAEQLRRAQGPR